jgi:putative oxidoreductase
MAGKGGDTSSSLGLLVLRAGTSAMLIFGHGWPKLAHFGERAHKFADPLHLGAPWSLALSIFAEFVCAALVLLGFATRIVVIPLLIQFGVIVFVVQGGQPFGERELALLYAVPFLALALLGPGRFSIDGARGNA